MCASPQVTRERTFLQLESAAAVYLSSSNGIDITPTELARTRGVDRSTIYRRATRLPELLSSVSPLRTQVRELSDKNSRLQARVQQLEQTLAPYQRGHWVEVTPERMALTTLEMTARNCSVSDVQATLKTAFALPKPPSDGTVAAIIAQGAHLAERVLDSVRYHYPLDAIEFDELFHANAPILAALEPYSMTLLMIEQLGNCRAHTWKFAFNYRDIEPPGLMVHDCSTQGNLLVKLFERDSQLCIFHRIRSIGRELDPQIERLYEDAIKTESERLWRQAESIEQSAKALCELTHLLDLGAALILGFYKNKAI